jgi:AraC family ethanolamine operon transcriptional activator
MGEASVNSALLADPDAVRIHDVDELNHAVSGSNLEVVQLRPGILQAAIAHRSIGDFSIDQGTVNLPLRVRGGLDPRRYAIGVFHGGTHATYNGNQVDSSRLLYFMPGGELDGFFKEPYGWTSLIIPPRWIESMGPTSRRADTLRLRTECRTFRPDAGKLAELRVAIDAIVTPQPMTDAPDHSDWLVAAMRNLLGELLSALDDPFDQEFRTLAHFSTARRAESYMRERMDEPLCIDDVCMNLRVSRRYLEYSFNDAFGVSPSRYLRLMRLHEVRRRLKRPGAGTTVTSEALRLGFNHLSLFSVQYKKTFGESPSATLWTGTSGTS